MGHAGDRRGAAVFRPLDRIVQFLAYLSNQLSAFICAVLIAATSIAMIIYQLGIAIAWLDDLLRLLLIWLVYLGTVSLCLDNDHIAMDALYVRMPASVRKVMDGFIMLLGLGLCVFTAKIGLDSMLQAVRFDELLPSGYHPAWLLYLAIPLCFAFMALAYLSAFVALLSGRHRARQANTGSTPDTL
ncbi:MAG: TRAP transporter small permease [Burkholderiales bacterium]